MKTKLEKENINKKHYITLLLVGLIPIVIAIIIIFNTATFTGQITTQNDETITTILSFSFAIVEGLVAGVFISLIPMMCANFVGKMIILLFNKKEIDVENELSLTTFTLFITTIILTILFNLLMTFNIIVF